jgi:hypothetical protein
MKFGKIVAGVFVRTPPLTKQRPVDAFGPAPLFASLDYREEIPTLVDQARPLGDQAAWVGYVCPGRTQDYRNEGTGGVYEMDHETYQTRKLA